VERILSEVENPSVVIRTKKCGPGGAVNIFPPFFVVV
jgi:hypothetical protein